MRKLILAMLATSALTVAIPMVAQAHDENGVAAAEDNYDNGGATYAQFDQEYQHISQGIQHGLSDGSYNRRQAYRFYSDLRAIRSRASYEERSGIYNPAPIQARLESLHERMHAAHEAGHQRLDSYNNNDWQGGHDHGNGGYDNRYGR